jgi:hypothetical protein
MIMMKKLSPLSAIAAGILLSTQVHAANGFSGNTTTITPNNCAVLDNNITVQLSKDVAAAYNCDATSFAAAACHGTGTDKSQTLTCLYYDDDNAANTPNVALPAYATAGCGAFADPAPTVAYTGRVAFGGDSGGGRVTTLPFPQTTCDATTVETATPDSMLDSGTSTSTDPT